MRVFAIGPVFLLLLGACSQQQAQLPVAAKDFAPQSPARATEPAGKWQDAKVIAANPTAAGGAASRSDGASMKHEGAVRKIDSDISYGCLSPILASEAVDHLRRKDVEAYVATVNLGLRNGTCRHLPRGEKVVLAELLSRSMIAGVRSLDKPDGMMLWVPAVDVMSGDELVKRATSGRR